MTSHTRSIQPAQIDDPIRAVRVSSASLEPASILANSHLPARPVRLDKLQSRYAQGLKRGIDILVAALVLIAVLPILVLLTLVLWLENGKPFYVQPRIGKGGRHFRMLKLRSMVADAEQILTAYLDADPALKREWALTQKLKNDPRITPIGRFIRRTSLDELPQLVNVLKGDMSLVGPRPMLPDQLRFYLHPSAYLAVRPGLSGLWQVTARNSDSFEMRAEIDRRYVETLSPQKDLRILLATFVAVVAATGH
ncbi:sugar transferase [Roseibaca sp. Y0-43]|uniref:sugar transferase n=1 Tax=Roseibaca sp. Y0-43 TaxID=2816854 RepID=UPI001D0CA43E|nr:sugar transferase [Roseibaca sp. Y0-43]MCC1482888.1 sugar transferase [Roseibaca sp. Y0-43]